MSRSAGCGGRPPGRRSGSGPLPALLAVAMAMAMGIGTAMPAQHSELRARIETLVADVRDLERRYDAPMSAARRERLARRYAAEIDALAADDWDQLGRDGRIDWLLLDNHVRRALRALEQAARRDAELAELLPFAARITALCEAQRRLEDVAARDAAAAVDAIAAAADEVLERCRTGALDAVAPALRERAAGRLGELRHGLGGWFRHRDGYDPQFSWWTRTPYEAADRALQQLAEAMRRPVDGQGAADRTLIGDPIGEAALLAELEAEWIPYSPAELIAIAEREFAWCDTEMAQAAADMGESDWRAALDRVKALHVDPGQQPALIRDLAHEAIRFLEQRDLITVPELAKECWRLAMMSREAQRVNPFFLGGNTIQVAFPTDAMTHSEKLQALRSNNVHFCRATVHHELIPGHWLQQYSQARHRQWRSPFSTPFWIEGWALYWEMRMYDLGLAQGPEDRVGMLYWRKHRCARIVFSLQFHLGHWSGPECVEYLIARVGHERAAATGEVRRSVGPGYAPLYQAAYMLGGLQLRRLHEELVASGGRSERDFHDEVLRQNSIPIAVLRAALRDEPPPRPLPAWRF